MEREEFEGLASCAACGAQVAADAASGYGFGTENVLCRSCALERGGRYDAARDVWEVEPDLTGLADEAYGAAPHEMRR